MKEYICAETQVKNHAGAITGTTLWKGKELVRCKDCKYHGNINEDYCQCLEQETNNDFFCWYGERK